MSIQVAPEIDIKSPIIRTNNTIVVNYPITLNMNVQRSTLSNCNTGHFVLYNLKQDTRRRVLKDIYATALSDQKSIVLNAGYVSELERPVIFKGDIQWAYSYRQKENWITEIQAFDGGDATINGQVNISQPSGYNIKQVIRNILGTMPNVGVGAIGNVGENQSGRGISVSGNSWAELQKLVPNAQCFIDNGVANVLDKNDYINQAGPVFLIDADTGLLETPRKFDRSIEVKILFEPRMKVGMLIQMQSIESFYNGLFSVQGVTHTGMISGAMSGQLYTTLSVWRGSEGLKGVNG